MNAGIIVAGILMYVFMGCANYNMPAINLLNATTEGVTLFELMKEGCLENVVVGDTVVTDFAARNLAVVMGYVLAVALAFIMLIAIINLLSNFGVIKNNKLAKICYLSNILMTVIVAISSILVVVGIGSYISVNELNKVSDIYSVGWAAVVNLILGLLVVVCALMAKPSTKKTKNSKK